MHEYCSPTTSILHRFRRSAGGALLLCRQNTEKRHEIWESCVALWWKQLLFRVHSVHKSKKSRTKATRSLSSSDIFYWLVVSICVAKILGGLLPLFGLSSRKFQMRRLYFSMSVYIVWIILYDHSICCRFRDYDVLIHSKRKFSSLEA